MAQLPIAVQSDSLIRYLKRASKLPFIYGGIGGTDCAFFLADWVFARTGFAVAEDLRGSYSNSAGWKRIAIRAGGLARLVGERASLAGYVETPTPCRGDIAVVYVQDMGPTCAIHATAHWIMKSAPLGITGHPIEGQQSARLLRAWTIPECPRP